MHSSVDFLEKIQFIKVTFKDLSATTRAAIDIDYELNSKAEDVIPQSFEGISDFAISQEEDSDKYDLHLFLHFGLRVVFKEEEEEADSNEDYEPLLEFMAQLEVIYESPEPIDFSEYEADHPIIEAFEQQAIKDAWPYWNEFIQSTSARLDLSGKLVTKRPE